MLLSFRTKEGYELCGISERRLKKGDFFLEIEEREPKIKELIREFITDKGVVYCFYKDKKLKAVYLFKQNMEEKNKILNLFKFICVDEITGDIKQTFDNLIIAVLSEEVALGAVKRVELYDKEIVSKMVKIDNYELPLGSSLVVILFLLLSLSLLLNWGNIMAIIFCVGVVFSTTCVIVRNKK